jgi:hypothetical protein
MIPRRIGPKRVRSVINPGEKVRDICHVNSFCVSGKSFKLSLTRYAFLILLDYT